MNDGARVLKGVRLLSEPVVIGEAPRHAAGPGEGTDGAPARLHLVESLDERLQEARAQGLAAGMEQGRREGEAAALAAAEARLQAVAGPRLKLVEALILALEEDRENLRADLRREVAHYLSRALEHLAGAAVSERMAAQVEALARAVGDAPEGALAGVLAAPAEVEMLKALLAALPGVPALAVHGDPRLAPGTLRLQAGKMELEASLDENLKAACEAASDALARGPEGPDSMSALTLPAVAQPLGRVVQVVGGLLEAEGLSVRLGELVRVGGGHDELLAEVVGFRQGTLLLSPLGDTRGIAPQAPVKPLGRPLEVKAGPALLGMVLDALGRPMDGSPLPAGLSAQPVIPLNETRNPMNRGRVTEPFETGIAAVDSMLTCGRGQRVGIFSGAGVGKSTLLGMLARQCEADVVVIALIGERGKEVRDFVEKEIGPQGMKRCVVVASTSEQPAQMRVQAALTATSLAEHFRANGGRVLLLMDSVTRFAHALREIGLAAGEPPTTKGYTPSVFAALPRLLERSGALKSGGSITGYYTVLVEGDNLNEPVADAVRGILDGHLVLSRELAGQGQYPAIDLLNSLSRSMPDVVAEPHRALATRARQLFTAMDRVRDLISVGAYREGSDPVADEARRLVPRLLHLMRQDPQTRHSLPASVARLKALLEEPAHEPG